VNRNKKGKKALFSGEDRHYGLLPAPSFVVKALGSIPARSYFFWTLKHGKNAVQYGS
jgi:hypothetical protein